MKFSNGQNQGKGKHGAGKVLRERRRQRARDRERERAAGEEGQFSSSSLWLLSTQKRRVSRTSFRLQQASSFCGGSSSASSVFSFFLYFLFFPQYFFWFSAAAFLFRKTSAHILCARRFSFTSLAEEKQFPRERASEFSSPARYVRMVVVVVS